MNKFSKNLSEAYSRESNDNGVNELIYKEAGQILAFRVKEFKSETSMGHPKNASKEERMKVLLGWKADANKV